jgi:hypothetical protein
MAEELCGPYSLRAWSLRPGGHEGFCDLPKGHEPWIFEIHHDRDWCHHMACLWGDTEVACERPKGHDKLPGKEGLHGTAAGLVWDHDGFAVPSWELDKM